MRTAKARRIEMAEVNSAFVTGATETHNFANHDPDRRSKMITSLVNRVSNKLLRPTYKPRPRWVQIMGGPLKGHSLYLDPEASEWQSEMLKGKYEAFIYDALELTGKVDSLVFWDVGAHIGYHTLAFAALAGSSGHVVSFEPYAPNAERCKQNFQRNPVLADRVTFINSALADEDGEAVFLFSDRIDNGESSGSRLRTSLLMQEAPAFKSHPQNSVRVSKADTLLSVERLPLPTIIKIDVEGAELQVLKGALKLLSLTKPLLIVEIHSVLMMFYVQSLLTSLGYLIDILDEDHGSPSRCHILAKSVP